MAARNEKNKTDTMIMRPLRNGFFIVVNILATKMYSVLKTAFADAVISYMM